MFCQGDPGPDVHKWVDVDMYGHPKPFRIKGDTQTKGLTAVHSKWTFAMPYKWRILSE
jgi:hypothetical protein